MNEQAQKILVDLLQKASNGIDSAVSFSQAQIPGVIQQLMVWNFASSIICQFFGMIFIVAPLFIRCHAMNARKNGEEWTAHDGRPRDSWFVSSLSYDICTFIAPIIGVVTGLIMIACNFDWLKIWLAPKLYLIEYAASLVK